MPGRPRTRLSQEIAHAAILSLRDDGPAPVPVLLARLGYLPADIEHLEELRSIHVPALRMAIRHLVREGPVAIDLDGRLRYHERGTSARTANREREAS